MKSLPYFVVGILLISSFAALGMEEEAVFDNKVIDIQFLEPCVIEGETYIELDVEGANARLYHAGEPMLPMHTACTTAGYTGHGKECSRV
jgi:hypothetical protein